MSAPAPERIGSYFETWTEKVFYPLDPREDEICIEDIAFALSNLSRFGGHCRFYSVASHSLEVVRHLIDMDRANLALAGLLHDASEAYLIDFPRPLKYYGEMGRLYRAAESKLTTCIFSKFGINEDGYLSPFVKLADDIALATEKRDLRNNTRGIKWGHLPPPSHRKVVSVPPAQAEAKFLSIFYELTDPLATQQ